MKEIKDFGQKMRENISAKLKEFKQTSEEKRLAREITDMLMRSHADECARSETPYTKNHYGQIADPENTWPHVIQELKAQFEKTDPETTGKVIRRVVRNTGYIESLDDITIGEAAMALDFFFRSKELEEVGYTSEGFIKILDEFEQRAMEQNLDWINVLNAEQALSAPLWAGEM